MNKQDRRVQKTRHAIRRAFTKLIQEKPLGSITISEIAREADIDRRTFYLHYSCVTDVIAAIEQEDGDKLRQVFQKEEGFDLETFFNRFTELLAENYDYYSIIIKNPEYSSFELRCKDILKDAITRTFQEKSKVKDEAFQVYSEYVASGIMGIYTNWVRTDSKMSLEELTKLAHYAVTESWDEAMGLA